MNRRFWLIGFLILGIAHISWAAFDFYKEAQVQETVSRDMDAAIRLYESYLQKPSPDRAKQADAYLHLGLCYDKVGNPEKAKAAWKKVVDNYADEPESYNEAVTQLKRIDMPERVVVQTSTPIVRVVHEETPPSWMVEFPRGMFLHTMDGKGRLIETAAGGSLGFVRFLNTNSAVGLEAGNLGASGPPSARRNIGYFDVIARWEKPLVSALTGYTKAGAGTYFFSFSNDQKSQTKINLGGTLEAGLTLGMPRGFAFNAGYVFHTFFQSTPSQAFRDTVPSADLPQASPVLQNRGLRFVGGPAVSLSIRW